MLEKELVLHVMGEKEYEKIKTAWDTVLRSDPGLAVVLVLEVAAHITQVEKAMRSACDQVAKTYLSLPGGGDSKKLVVPLSDRSSPPTPKDLGRCEYCNGVGATSNAFGQIINCNVCRGSGKFVEESSAKNECVAEMMRQWTIACESERLSEKAARDADTVQENIGNDYKEVPAPRVQEAVEFMDNKGVFKTVMLPATVENSDPYVCEECVGTGECMDYLDRDGSYIHGIVCRNCEGLGHTTPPSIEETPADNPFYK
jgi:hypothetical protein